MTDMTLLLIAGAIISVIFLGLYLWTLVHILKNGDIGFVKKVLWILVLLLAPVVGMILYYMIQVS